MKTRIAPRAAPRAVESPPPGQALSRSFNASMARWNAQRRGQAPESLWGARAIAALAPWEEGDLCLSHAVALALEAAYQEGKAGLAPSLPDVRAELRPSATPAECEDCDHPQETIVKHAGNLHTDGIDRTEQPVIQKPGAQVGRHPAIIHRAGMVKPAPIIRAPIARRSPRK